MTHTAPMVIIDPTSAFLFSINLGTFIEQLITTTTEIILAHKKKKTKDKTLKYNTEFLHIFCQDLFHYISLIGQHFIQSCVSNTYHIQYLPWLLLSIQWMAFWSIMKWHQNADCIHTVSILLSETAHYEAHDQGRVWKSAWVWNPF